MRSQIGSGRSERLLLRLGRGIERVEGARHRPPVSEGDSDFELGGVDLRAPPEDIIGLGKRLLHPLPRGLRLGAVARQRLIGHERPRRHGFEFRLLVGEERVGVADQGAQDEREQEREQADHGKDHVLRAARHMALRQSLLDGEPEEAAPERHDRDHNRYPY
jgi:hypothetical protein